MIFLLSIDFYFTHGATFGDKDILICHVLRLASKSEVTATSLRHEFDGTDSTGERHSSSVAFVVSLVFHILPFLFTNDNNQVYEFNHW
jgi:hypothetical protein